MHLAIPAHLDAGVDGVVGVAAAFRDCCTVASGGGGALDVHRGEAYHAWSVRGGTANES